jgi:putative nucleotidyltransferase with HDIG domain
VALIGNTSRRPHEEDSGRAAARAPLEVASGHTPRSMQPLEASDAYYGVVNEKRWRARIASFSGPALYVPVVSPPHPGVLVKMLLRDRTPAVGEVLWSRTELPLAGAAVRYVRVSGSLGVHANSAAGSAGDVWGAMIASTGVPSLPDAAAGVLRATSSARSGAAEVAKSLGQDPELAKAVLDLANTANFRATEPLKDVRAAVVRLGVERVRSLVLASSVFEIFPAESDAGRSAAMDERVSPAGLWMHSLASGLAAEALAKLAGIPPDDAFLAGLFHDIGKFVLADVMSAGYSAVLDQVEEWGLTLVEAEKAVWGFSHARAGAWLLSKWGLPGQVVAAVASHHAASGGGRSPLAAAAHVGDLVARALAAGTTWDRRMPSPEPAYWDALRLDPEEISAAVQGAAYAVAAGAAVFEQAGVRPPFISRSAHATEADPILREAADAAARRRCTDLFEGAPLKDPYLGALAKGAAAVSAAQR